MFELLGRSISIVCLELSAGSFDGLRVGLDFSSQLVSLSLP